MPKIITRKLEFIQFLTDSRPIDSLPGRPYMLAAWKVSADGLSLDPWESDSIFNAFDSLEKFEFYFLQSDGNNLGYVLYSDPDQTPPNLLPPTPTPTTTLTSTPTPTPTLTPTPTTTPAPYIVMTSPSGGVSPAQFGVSLVSESGSSISFNSTYDFSGLPANMNIYISDVQVATVTFTHPYLGMPFVFAAISNGSPVDYQSVFVGTFNSPGRVDFYPPTPTQTPTLTLTNTPTQTPTNTPTSTQAEQDINTTLHISYDDVGNEYLQVSNAYAGPTGGGSATSQLRTIYKFAPDSNSSPSYAGSAWPYVLIQGALQVGAGISATITEGLNRHLIVNGRPVYQYTGNASSGTANGISSTWPAMTPSGNNTISVPVGVLTLVNPSSPTLTPTFTPTSTPTLTPTFTPTSTPTLTPTFTPTSTPTLTPTSTPTSTPTFTLTNTPTQTPTPTLTNTPTQTPTPTLTNTPTQTPTPTPTQLGYNYANYSRVADWNGQDGNLTTVGTNGGPSYYGTLDQSGNVWEWNEAASGTNRCIRGGSWSSVAPYVDFQTFYLSSSYRTFYGASNRSSDVGFRVASAPGFASALGLSDFVSVGDLLGSADTTGYGSVNYNYEISKYPTTQSQYVEFLNAMAATDTYGLYNSDMASDSRGGITRGSVAGSYVYSVKASMGDKPVNFVSWLACARYCNWLHNGKPTGPQNASTTENGSYAISGTSATRISGASFWMPTENEWYKAAYFSMSKNGGVGGYWKYATQSDANPTPVSSNIIGDGPFVPA